ncbi:MAG: M28 family peptidase, partial [Gemmatimonadota bacterium]
GYGQTFVPVQGLAITDDHIPLLQAGLRVIDVIDLDYPWHHTPDDTIEAHHDQPGAPTGRQILERILTRTDTDTTAH